MHRAPNKSFETAGKEWHQWMVINIPGNNLTAGETIYRYLQAGDPKLDGKKYLVSANSKPYFKYQHRFTRTLQSQTYTYT